MTRTLIDEYAELARSVSDKQRKLEVTLDEIRSITERRDRLQGRMSSSGPKPREDLQDQITKCADKLRHLHSEAIDQRHAVRLASIKVDCAKLRLEYEVDA